MATHGTALSGFATDTSRYDRARPTYPQDAVDDWITRVTGESDVEKAKVVAKGMVVVELGSGTGKFTRLVAPFFQKIICVEPVIAMNGELLRSLPEGTTNVEVIEGNAASIPLADESVDVVHAAQAFHWFANEDSLKDMVRVLKPAGHLSFIWNFIDSTETEWVGDVRAVVEANDSAVPQYRLGMWRNAFHTDTAKKVFGEEKAAKAAGDFVPERPSPGSSVPASGLSHLFQWHIPGDRQLLWDRQESKSYISLLPQEKRDEVKAGVFAAMDKHNIGMDGSNIDVPYRTEVFVIEK
eukprot:TRINITY_DN1309_c0_g4_i1.p1 TRINITY_DN1309_c0_g4~~TRINITY_DN1309_c0_g4_i1.p1  ORF type:complete len:296 (+),score=63.90 TRINITY_DN1309_c0_g4_i1:159-1046(+)